MEKTKIFLDENDMPKKWYNIQADLPKPLPPVYSPRTMDKVTLEELSVLFPMEILKQEMSQDRWISIPEEVRDIFGGKNFHEISSESDEGKMLNEVLELADQMVAGIGMSGNRIPSETVILNRAIRALHGNKLLSKGMKKATRASKKLESQMTSRPGRKSNASKDEEFDRSIRNQQRKMYGY